MLPNSTSRIMLNITESFQEGVQWGGAQPVGEGGTILSVILLHVPKTKNITVVGIHSCISPNKQVVVGGMIGNTKRPTGSPNPKVTKSHSNSIGGTYRVLSHGSCAFAFENSGYGGNIHVNGRSSVSIGDCSRRGNG